MTVIHLAGNLTIECVAAVHQQLGQDLARHGAALLTLDLGDVTELDGAGLQLLLAFAAAAAQSGRSVALRRPPEALDQVLQQCGLAARFQREAAA